MDAKDQVLKSKAKGKATAVTSAAQLIKVLRRTRWREADKMVNQVAPLVGLTSATPCVQVGRAHWGYSESTLGVYWEYTGGTVGVQSTMCSAS